MLNCNCPKETKTQTKNQNKKNTQTHINFTYIHYRVCMLIDKKKNHTLPIFIKSIKRKYYKALIYLKETTEEEMEQTFTRTRKERLHEN